MSQVAFSPKQSRFLEILSVVLVMFLIGFGLLYQFQRWKLDGSALILVGVLFVNYLNFVSAELSRASARVDALEQRLAALERPH